RAVEWRAHSWSGFEGPRDSVSETVHVAADTGNPSRIGHSPLDWIHRAVQVVIAGVDRTHRSIEQLLAELDGRVAFRNCCRDSTNRSIGVQVDDGYIARYVVERICASVGLIDYDAAWRFAIQKNAAVRIRVSLGAGEDSSDARRPVRSNSGL